MPRHVHGADPQHGAIEVEAMKHFLPEVISCLRVLKQFRMVVAKIFTGLDQQS